jgi:hypothetical protein
MKCSVQHALFYKLHQKKKQRPLLFSFKKKHQRKAPFESIYKQGEVDTNTKGTIFADPLIKFVFINYRQLLNKRKKERKGD